ncbi:MAG: nitroreductase/quinone reductase family protein [Myxococcota bacterium]|nr:nitroreductase/quinone reductase family protein [Myxococcota bacterium]
MRIEKLLYALLNPVVRGLLRSPLHRVGSRNLALLCYRGRRSGRPYATPLSYVREGSTVRFLSSRQTRWWTNFTEQSNPVEIEIGKQKFQGQARLFQENNSALLEGVRLFISRLPRDAVVYGIKLDAERKPIEASLQKAIQQMILVEVELNSTQSPT